MTNITQEISEITKATEEFSEEMKATLLIEASHGKRGWNKMSESDLAKILNEKLGYYYSNGRDGPQDEFDEEALLTIVNWCMFVYKAKKDKR